MNLTDTRLLPDIVAIAKKAGASTLPFFEGLQAIGSEQKIDGTILTKADLASDQLIRRELLKLTPQYPVLTEETADQHDWETRQTWQTYWLVDPLDGTRGFVQGDPFYTVNIALVHRGRPRLGVVYQPVDDTLYAASAGQGVYCVHKGNRADDLHTRPCDLDRFSLISGHFDDGDTYLDCMESDPEVEVRRMNSSFKFCLIASGEIDVYPKYGITCEWDTAAAQVILEEAGGAIVDLSGKPLTYNSKESLINPSFLALGDPVCQEALLERCFGSSQ